MRFDVQSAEKSALQAQRPLHLVIVASASRDEVATPAEAQSLSERRVHVVADLVRAELPNLAPDKINLLPLGWDGFSSPKDDHRVLVTTDAFSADDLPTLFVGPAVAAPRLADLEGRLRAAKLAAEKRGPDCALDDGDISFVIQGSAEGEKGLIGAALLYEPSGDPKLVGTLHGSPVYEQVAVPSPVGNLLAPFLDALSEGCRFRDAPGGE